MWDLRNLEFNEHEAALFQKGQTDYVLRLHTVKGLHCLNMQQLYHTVVAKTDELHQSYQHSSHHHLLIHEVSCSGNPRPYDSQDAENMNGITESRHKNLI